MSEATAVKAIDHYLRALHKGLARHFGERFPSCCADASTLVVNLADVPPDDLLAGLVRVDW
jgi:hypothetical protein